MDSVILFLGTFLILAGFLISTLKPIALMVYDPDRIKDDDGYCRWVGLHLTLMGVFSILNMLLGKFISDYSDLTFLGYITILIILGINMSIGCRKYRI